jgi:hypothetical protein
MRYLKKFNESEVNQEKVNWDIEEEARLYLAYLIDSNFSIEATGSEYNDNGDVLVTSVVIYKSVQVYEDPLVSSVVEFNWNELDSDILTWLNYFKYNCRIYAYNVLNSSYNFKEYTLEQLEYAEVGKITKLIVHIIHEQNEINESYVNSFDEDELISMFNLILPGPELYKLPYSHYGDGTNVDFNVYIITGLRSERDDHKFLQELYFNHEILKKMYNLEFFHISLTEDGRYATIVLFDHKMNPSYIQNEDNYLQRISEVKLRKVLPDGVINRVKLSAKNPYNKELYKGISYSNGNVSNISLSKWIYDQEEDFRKQYEDISVPIKVGDTILGGKFKNRKVIVKKIGKNKKGDITVNDKPLLKYRIIKESISNVDIESYLAYLIDDGFTIYKKNGIFKNSIHIYKLNNSELSENINNLQMLDNDKLEMEIIPFIELFKNDIESISMSCKSNEYYRVKLTPDIIIKRGFTENIIKIVIILK